MTKQQVINKVACRLNELINQPTVETALVRELSALLQEITRDDDYPSYSQSPQSSSLTFSTPIPTAGSVGSGYVSSSGI